MGKRQSHNSDLVEATGSSRDEAANRLNEPTRHLSGRELLYLVEEAISRRVPIASAAYSIVKVSRV